MLGFYLKTVLNLSRSLGASQNLATDFNPFGLWWQENVWRMSFELYDMLLKIVKTTCILKRVGSTLFLSVIAKSWCVKVFLDR